MPRTIPPANRTPTKAIYNRFCAGASVEDLAAFYQVHPRRVEAIIRGRARVDARTPRRRPVQI